MGGGRLYSVLLFWGWFVLAWGNASLVLLHSKGWLVAPREGQ